MLQTDNMKVEPLQTCIFETSMNEQYFETANSCLLLSVFHPLHNAHRTLLQTCYKPQHRGPYFTAALQ